MKGVKLKIGDLVSVDEIERAHVLSVLESKGCDKKAAVKVLRISPRCLDMKLHQWDVFDKYRPVRRARAEA